MVTKSVVQRRSERKKKQQIAIFFGAILRCFKMSKTKNDVLICRFSKRFGLYSRRKNRRTLQLYANSQQINKTHYVMSSKNKLEPVSKAINLIKREKSSSTEDFFTCKISPFFFYYERQ